MATHSGQEVAQRRTLTKKGSKNNLKSIAKAIPGHLAPLIPSFESFQGNETKNMTDDLTNRAAGLEPHYDFEHFVPEDEQGYRGVLKDPLGSHNPRHSTVRPKHIDRQRRKPESRTAVSPDTASLIHTYNHGQQASVTASYVDRLRHRELMPDYTNHDQVIADCVAPLRTYELDAPTTRSPSVQIRIPKIIITPSSPTDIAFKSEIFDNTLLTPPPICYKRKERRRQVSADQERMLELLRSRSASSFSNVEAPDRVQLDVEPIRSLGSLRNVDVPRRVRRTVEPVRSPFERYAHSLFG